MEVKINADELCELRKRAEKVDEKTRQLESFYANGHGYSLCQLSIDLGAARGKISTLEKERDSLLHETKNLRFRLAEAHAKNVDYHVTCDWEKLEKERDFWRSEALSVARTFEDMALKGVSGQILVSIPMKDRARWHGYKLE